MLSMDLRPLREGKPAAVTAAYTLRNDEAEKTLELVFVAAALAEDEASVSLDGQPVKLRVTNLQDLPANWQPPRQTPGINGQREISYSVRANRGFEFSVILPPGGHRIEARYTALPAAYSGDSPTRYWQLGYVLAPARQWAGFGGLDVTVQLPDNWLAASSPVLTRTGSTLSGSFDQLPADAIGLTVQSPPPRVPNVVPLSVLGGLLALVLIAALAGSWLGRRKRTSLWAAPLSLLLGFGWMVAILVGLGVSDPTGHVPPEQQAWTYGYGEGPGWLAIMFLALLLGVPIAMLSAVIAHRVSKRRT